LLTKSLKLLFAL